MVPSGRGGVGVEVESCAECCPARPVAGPGADRVVLALVPGGCAGQSPVRGGGSLRTLAGPARGPCRGGCSASPGRGAWGLAPRRSGLRPVRPGGLGVLRDDRGGLQAVDDRRDGQVAVAAVGERRGLVGEAAGGERLRETTAGLVEAAVQRFARGDCELGDHDAARIASACRTGSPGTGGRMARFAPRCARGQALAVPRPALRRSVRDTRRGLALVARLDGLGDERHGHGQGGARTGAGRRPDLHLREPALRGDQLRRRVGHTLRHPAGRTSGPLPAGRTAQTPQAAPMPGPIERLGPTVYRH